MQKLKGALEDNILTMLCFDIKNSAQLVLKLTPDLFSTRAYRRIAEAAFAYHAQFNGPPRAHLRDLLEDELRRGDEGLLLQKILDDIDALVPEIQPDYVLSELDKFIGLRKTAAAIEKASDALHAGDLAGAHEAMYSADLGIKKSSGIWLHKPEQSLAFMNAVPEEDFFPSGVEVLDQHGIRPARKTVFLIVAPKKTGKSFWCVEIGKQCLLYGKRVLHITLENSDDLTAKRYVQSLFAMSAKEMATIRVPVFERDSLGRFTNIGYDTRTPEFIRPEIRNSIAGKLERLGGRASLLIQEFPSDSLSIGQLNAFIDSLKRTADDFEPDLMILDMPDLMAIGKGDFRLALGAHFRAIRGVAGSRNMAIVCPTQGNRQSESARVVNSTMIAEDWSKAGTADTVCCLMKTKMEREIGLARIFVDSARTDEDKFIVMISQNYATGQFCIDSVYMNKYVEQEVERLNGDEEE